MIEIIKEGNPKKAPRITYRTICVNCGCEFTYENEDTKISSDYISYIQCPCCKKCLFPDFSNRKVEVSQ